MYVDPSPSVSLSGADMWSRIREHWKLNKLLKRLPRRKKGAERRRSHVAKKKRGNRRRQLQHRQKLYAPLPPKRRGVAGQGEGVHRLV